MTKFLARGYKDEEENMSFASDGRGADGTHSESLRGCSSDHRGVVSAETVKEPPHVVLGSVGSVRVHGGEEGACRGPRGEPVTRRESFEEGEVVLGQLSWRELYTDLGERVGGLVTKKKRRELVA